MEISLSRGYNELSFREDLKVLYNRLGIENRRIVFMFGDQHVVEDGTRQTAVTTTTLPGGIYPLDSTDEATGLPWAWAVETP